MGKLPCRELTFRLVIKDTFDVDAIQQRTCKITENDLNEQLQPAALQVSWGHLRHFFTPSAYNALRENLQVLHSMVNTCQLCMVPYNGEAPIVGCDNCGYWFHFICVWLRKAPPAKRDWHCLSCRKWHIVPMFSSSLLCLLSTTVTNTDPACDFSLLQGVRLSLWKVCSWLQQCWVFW